MSEYYSEEKGFNFGKPIERLLHQNYLINADLELARRILDKQFKNPRRAKYDLAVVKRLLRSSETVNNSRIQMTKGVTDERS